jgi:hypothetical protein
VQGAASAATEAAANALAEILAEKTTAPYVGTKIATFTRAARSRRSAFAIGALIGLVLGAIAAILSDTKATGTGLGRTRTA